MAVRALIIAIENYADMAVGFAPSLPGTHQSALKFRRWLLETKGVRPEDILFCADDPSLEGCTSPAGARHIEKALGALVDLRDIEDTTEFFFFFSGHGFRLENSPVETPMDILIGQHFDSPQDGGSECLKLEQIQQRLRAWMGTGHHYYFIDACRNTIGAVEISPRGIGITRSRASTGDALVYSLYSTRPGATAAVGQAFPKHLVQGLGGRGRAKAWWGGDMFVDFRSLARFMKENVSPQEVDWDHKKGEGLILKIDPIPELSWTVVVEGANDADEFEVKLANNRRQPIDLQGENRFRGSTFTLRRTPDDYILEVANDDGPLEAVEAPPTDLFEDRESRFRIPVLAPGPPAAAGPAAPTRSPLGPRRGGGFAMAASEDPPDSADPAFPGPTPTRSFPTEGTLRIAAPPQVRVRVRDLQSGDLEKELVGTGDSRSHTIRPGAFLIRAIDDNGSIFREVQVEVAAGERVNVELRHQPGPQLRALEVLRERFAHADGMAFFSERIGPVPGEDLGVWLSILGASRIVDNPHSFSKMAGIPLATFEDVDGGSPVYVLTALKTGNDLVRVGLSRDDRPDWQDAARVDQVAGLHHLRLDAPTGGHLLSIKAGAMSSITTLTHTLRDYATLIVVTNAGGELRIHQHLLPLYHRLDQLPVEIRDNQPANPIAAVRFVAEAQRRFSRRQPLAPVDLSTSWAEHWRLLLAGLWLDPIMVILGAFELIREGQSTEAQRLVELLLGHFPTLPDSPILAELSGIAGGLPSSGPPMSIESLSALEFDLDSLPLPQSHLDYSTPWTTWLNAVRLD